MATPCRARASRSSRRRTRCPTPPGCGRPSACCRPCRACTEDDIVLALISGGGSSLLPLPLPGLNLADKQALNRALLASGATIREMNCVRRHLSAIKGGRLAAACHPARVISLLMSDVPGDAAVDIASGPTVADPSTCADALEVLRRYGIAVPPAVRQLLESGQGESVKPGDPRLARNEARLVAAPQASLEAAAAVAREAGWPAHILGDALEGEARDVGARAGRHGAASGRAAPALPAALRAAVRRRDHRHRARQRARRAQRGVPAGLCRRHRRPPPHPRPDGRHRRRGRTGRDRRCRDGPADPGPRLATGPAAAGSPGRQRRPRLLRGAGRFGASPARPSPTSTTSAPSWCRPTTEVHRDLAPHGAGRRLAGESRAERPAHDRPHPVRQALGRTRRPHRGRRHRRAVYRPPPRARGHQPAGLRRAAAGRAQGLARQLHRRHRRPQHAHHRLGRRLRRHQATRSASCRSRRWTPISWPAARRLISRSWTGARASCTSSGRRTAPRCRA